MTRALLPLADGVEEMEAVILTDTLRRARWTVVSAAVGPSATVTASRNVRLVADVMWADVRAHEFDVLLIPGGAGGTAALLRHGGVLAAIHGFAAAGKLVAAICAGPLVLQAAGVLKGRRATCYPDSQAQLTDAVLTPGRVVMDGNIVTSLGPGSAFELALALIELRDGAEARARVAEGLALPTAAQPAFRRSPCSG
jgi:4-methyl-5(b-hydroxyethyl)-thiazole monophosphate biosynthesis